jgi:methionine salvage enolase-phosphatase E1
MRAGGRSERRYEMLKGLNGVTSHEHREWIPITTSAASGALRETLTQLQRDHADEVSRGEQPPEWDASDPQSVPTFIEWLMDRYRKASGLKSLQGQIWARGFAQGRSEVRLQAGAAPGVWQHAVWRPHQRNVRVF